MSLLSCHKDEPVYTTQPTIYLKDKDSVSNIRCNPLEIISDAQVTFDASRPAQADIIIFDRQGRTQLSLLQQTIKSGHNSFIVNLANLNSGVYFLNIKAFNNSYFIKLIKI